MKAITRSKARFFATMIVSFVLFFFETTNAQNTSKITHIVLVHGAFVDGSGWQPVYDILTKKGYHVTVTQQPLTSFDADVAAVREVLQQQDRPCILVGHSYGGAVITIAGNDTNVVGIVYIAAHAPDEGESEAANGKIYPPAYTSLLMGQSINNLFLEKERSLSRGLTPLGYCSDTM